MVPPNGQRRRWRLGLWIGLACTLSLSVGPARALDLATNVEAAEQAIRVGDFRRAGQLLLALSQAGHVASQYRLAAMYRNGRGLAKNNQKALFWMRSAARRGDVRAVLAFARMLQYGIGSQADRRESIRLLKRAADGGNAEARRLLAKGGAVVKRFNFKGSPWTARISVKGRKKLGATAQPSRDSDLRLAASRGIRATARLLIQKGLDLNRPDKQGNTALMLAAKGGHAKVVDDLIEAGANIGAVNHDGDSALALAVRLGHVPVAEKLLMSGASVTNEQSGDAGSLRAAVGTCRGTLLRRLAERASIQKIGSTSAGALLRLAAARCPAKIAAGLLAFGTPLNGIDSAGRSALWYAADAGRPDVIGLLIARGGNVDRADRSGVTPLHRGLQRRQGQVSRLLIAASKAIDRPSSVGNTPLMLAANGGLAAAVKQLIARRAQLDLKNQLGMTALMLAAARGHDTVVRLLLAAGADPGRRNRNRETAKDLASARGYEKVVEQFRSQ